MNHTKVNFSLQEETVGRIAEMAQATRLRKSVLVDIGIQLLEVVGVDAALATLNSQSKQPTKKISK